MIWGGFTPLFLVQHPYIAGCHCFKTPPFWSHRFTARDKWSDFIWRKVLQLHVSPCAWERPDGWVQWGTFHLGELNLPNGLRTGKLKDFYKTELKRTGTKISWKNLMQPVTLSCVFLLLEVPVELDDWVWHPCRTQAPPQSVRKLKTKPKGEAGDVTVSQWLPIFKHSIPMSIWQNPQHNHNWRDSLRVACETKPFFIQFPGD